MPVSPNSIQEGKCYLAEPGDRVLRVLEITPGNNIKYVERASIEGGGLFFSMITVSRGRFAQEVMREVPCD